MFVNFFCIVVFALIAKLDLGEGRDYDRDK
jgi:hypothetical protein